MDRVFRRHKVIEDTTSKSQRKFLSDKDSSQRLKHLRILIEQTDRSDLQRFFDENQSIIFYSLSDAFWSIQQDLKQKVNGANIKELTTVLYVFENLLILLPDVIHKRWQYNAIRDILTELLHEKNSLHIRKCGIRLFLLWFQILGSNKTLSCHRQFINLVPCFGPWITEYEKLDLEASSNLSTAIDPPEMGRLTTDAIFSNEHENISVYPRDTSVLVPANQVDQPIQPRQLEQQLLHHFLYSLSADVTKVCWSSNFHSKHRLQFWFLFEELKRTYLPVIFPCLSPLYSVYEPSRLDLVRNADSVLADMHYPIPPVLLPVYQEIFVIWLSSYLDTRPSCQVYSRESSKSSETQSGRLSMDDLIGNRKDIALSATQKSDLSSELSVATLGPTSSSACMRSESDPADVTCQPRAGDLINAGSNRHARSITHSDRTRYLTEQITIVRTVLLGCRQNINLLHDIFHHTFLLPIQCYHALSAVVGVYTSWLENKSTRPIFMKDKHRKEGQSSASANTMLSAVTVGPISNEMFELADIGQFQNADVSSDTFSLPSPSVQHNNLTHFLSSESETNSPNVVNSSINQYQTTSPESVRSQTNSSDGDEEELNGCFQLVVKLMLKNISKVFLLTCPPAVKTFTADSTSSERSKQTVVDFVKQQVHLCRRILHIFRVLAESNELTSESWELLLNTLLDIMKSTMIDSSLDDQIDNSWLSNEKLIHTFFQTVNGALLRASLFASISNNPWDQCMALYSKLTHWPPLIAEWKKVMQSLTKTMANLVYGVDLTNLPEVCSKRFGIQRKASRPRPKSLTESGISQFKPAIISNRLSSHADPSLQMTTTHHHVSRQSNLPAVASIGTVSDTENAISRLPEPINSFADNVGCSKSQGHSGTAIDDDETSYSFESNGKIVNSQSSPLNQSLNEVSGLSKMLQRPPRTNLDDHLFRRVGSDLEEIQPFSASTGEDDGLDITISPNMVDNNAHRQSGWSRMLSESAMDNAPTLPHINGCADSQYLKSSSQSPPATLSDDVSLQSISPARGRISTDLILDHKLDTRSTSPEGQTRRSELSNRSTESGNSNFGHVPYKRDDTLTASMRQLDIDATVAKSASRSNGQRASLSVSRCLLAGGSTRGFTEESVIVCWRRFLGILGCINKIQNHYSMERVHLYINELIRSLLKIQQYQLVYAPFPNSVQLRPYYAVPFEIILPTLFEATTSGSLPDDIRCLAIKSLCQAVIRPPDRQIDMEILSQFYRTLHRLLVGSELSYKYVIMRSCGYCLIGSDLPGSHLLVLSSLAAIHEILKSTSTNKIPPYNESVVMLITLLCYPNYFQSLNCLDPSTLDDIQLVPCTDLESRLLEQFIQTVQFHPSAEARCYSLSALTMKFIIELSFLEHPSTLQFGPSSLKNPLVILLGMMRSPDHVISVVSVEMVRILAFYCDNILSLAPSIPSLIIRTLTWTLHGLWNSIQLNYLNSVDNRLLACLIMTITEWCLRLPRSILLSKENIPTNSSSDVDSPLTMVLTVLYSIISSSPSTGVNQSEDENQTEDTPQFSDSHGQLGPDPLLVVLPDCHYKISGESFSMINPQTEPAAQTTRSFLKCNYEHSRSFSQQSGFNAQSDTDALRLTARIALCNVLNHLDHFPLDGQGAQFHTSVQELHDQTLEDADEANELNLAVFEQSNVQLFAINDSILLSLISLPVQNNDRLVPKCMSSGSADVLGRSSSSRFSRVIIRDFSGKYSWDLSYLHCRFSDGNGFSDEDSIFPWNRNVPLPSPPPRLHPNPPPLLPDQDQGAISPKGGSNIILLNTLLNEMETNNAECLLTDEDDDEEDVEDADCANMDVLTQAQITSQCHMDDESIKSMSIKPPFDLDWGTKQRRSFIRQETSSDGDQLEQTSSNNQLDNFASCRHLLNQLGFLSFERRATVELVQISEALVRELRQFDKFGVREVHKIAVFYIGSGQEDKQSILANETASLEFENFVAGLGWEISVLNHQGYRGGLEPSGRVGTSTAYYATSTLEVLFHISTRMPSSTQEDLKYRHLGNDAVMIIWTENARPFTRNVLRTQFGDVLIIISPLSTGLFRVEVRRESEVGFFGPIVQTAVLDGRVLPGLVRATAINASRSVRFMKPNAHYEERAASLQRIISQYTLPCCFEDYAQSLVFPEVIPESDLPLRQTESEHRRSAHTSIGAYSTGGLISAQPFFAGAPRTGVMARDWSVALQKQAIPSSTAASDVNSVNSNVALFMPTFSPHSSLLQTDIVRDIIIYDSPDESPRFRHRSRHKHANSFLHRTNPSTVNNPGLPKSSSSDRNVDEQSLRHNLDSISSSPFAVTQPPIIAPISSPSVSSFRHLLHGKSRRHAAAPEPPIH